MAHGPLGSDQPVPGYQYSQGRSRILSAQYVAPANATSTAVHAAVTDTGSTQTITTAITNPDVPRQLVATPGGTVANVTAVSVVVTGTDIYGNVITETLPAFSAGAGTAKNSVNAFATVTSISQPAIGTGVTVSYGVTNALGLPVALSRNTVVAAFLNGAKEGTAPTVVTNSVISKNLVTLATTLNGNDVIIDYYK